MDTQGENDRPTKIVGLGNIGRFASDSIAIIDALSDIGPGEIQKIAASQIKLLASIYETVHDQARHSFRVALVSAGVGLLFFLGAIGSLLSQETQNLANISIVSGAIIEVISGINFYLYFKASSQLAYFNEQLDRTQRFLLANSICESLSGTAQEVSRSQLVAHIAGFAIEPNNQTDVETDDS